MGVGVGVGSGVGSGVGVGVGSAVGLGLGLGVGLQPGSPGHCLQGFQLHPSPSEVTSRTTLSTLSHLVIKSSAALVAPAPLAVVAW